MRQLSLGLSRVPSLIYGVAYLALVPVFAVVYGWLPEQFYTTTARYELPLRIHAERILVVLGYFVRANQPPLPSQFVCLGRRWEFDARATYLTDLTVLEGKWMPTPNEPLPVSFIAHASAGAPRGAMVGSGLDGRSPRVDVEFEVSGSVGLLDSETSFREQTSADDDSVGWPVHVQVHTSGGRVSSSGDALQEKKLVESVAPLLRQRVFAMDSSRAEAGAFRLPWWIRREVLEYGHATAGFAGFSSGGFERMLYLSAVTITTLGYGDIVPITALTRFLVWFEAVLGIALIGLVFNSIAHEAQRAGPKQ
jgi:hypothetical protein